MPPTQPAEHRFASPRAESLPRLVGEEGEVHLSFDDCHRVVVQTDLVNGIDLGLGTDGRGVDQVNGEDICRRLISFTPLSTTPLSARPLPRGNSRTR